LKPDGVQPLRTGAGGGSGWFFRPGKLKPIPARARCGRAPPWFRMVLPSGEVETRSIRCLRRCCSCSGWFFRPGKLKRGGHSDSDAVPAGSGWFFRPGKLKRVTPSSRPIFQTQRVNPPLSSPTNPLASSNSLSKLNPNSCPGKSS
jgi:hypothetical protein